MSTLRQRIVGAVVGVLAGGGAVTAALLAASEQEAVALDVAQAETRAAIVEATMLLRQMGRPPETIATELAELSRVPLADLAPIVGTAYGAGDGRDPATLRSESVAVAYSLAEADVVAQTWAAALCEPLTVLPALSEAHSACVTSQAQLGGAPACIDGGPVGGYVVEMPATPAQAERLRTALAGLATVGTSGVAVRQARGWTTCADEVMP